MWVDKQVKWADKINWNYSLSVACKLVILEKLFDNEENVSNFYFYTSSEKILWMPFACSCILCVSEPCFSRDVPLWLKSYHSAIWVLASQMA